MTIQVDSVADEGVNVRSTGLLVAMETFNFSYKCYLLI